MNRYHGGQEPKHPRINSPPRSQSPSKHHQDQGQLSTGSKSESPSLLLLLGAVQPQGEGKAVAHLLKLPPLRKDDSVKTANLHTGKTPRAPLCSPRLPPPQQMLPNLSTPGADLRLLVGGSREGDIECRKSAFDEFYGLILR